MVVTCAHLEAKVGPRASGLSVRRSAFPWWERAVATKAARDVDSTIAANPVWIARRTAPQVANRIALDAKESVDFEKPGISGAGLS